MPCVVELGVFFYLWNIHYPFTITNSNSVVTSWDCRLIWQGRLFQVSVSEPRRAIVESFVFIACSCQFWPKTTDTAQENQGGLFFVHPRSLLGHELLAKKKTNKETNQKAKQNKKRNRTVNVTMQPYFIYKKNFMSRISSHLCSLQSASFSAIDFVCGGFWVNNFLVVWLCGCCDSIAKTHE